MRIPAFTLVLTLFISSAVRYLHTSPKEALCATTKGGAAAPMHPDGTGQPPEEANADLIAWDEQSHLHTPYPMVEIKFQLFSGK